MLEENEITKLKLLRRKVHETKDATAEEMEELQQLVDKASEDQIKRLYKELN